MNRRRSAHRAWAGFALRLTPSRMRVPVFTVLPGKPDRGTLFDAGPDFYQVGLLGGDLPPTFSTAAT